MLGSGTNAAIDLNLRYIQAELARMDVVIRREIRRWNLAGQDPHDDYRGMYVSRVEVEALLARNFGVSWGQTVTLDPAEEQTFAEALAYATHQAQLLAETMAKQGQVPRLLQMATVFGLSRLEVDILLLCLAPAFDSRYDRLYGYLQDNVNRRRPMVRLVLDLLGQPGPERFLLASYFDPEAPLFKYELLEHIVEPGAANPHWINQTLHPDETVVAWLMGRYQPHPALRQHATWQWPQITETDHLLTTEVWARLVRPVATPPVIIFYGPDEAGQHAAARRLADHFKRPLFTVDLVTATEGGLSPLRAIKLALRDARLTGALPLLTGWTACLGVERSPPPQVLAELCAYPGLAIVAGEATWQPRGLDRQRPLLWLSFPKPAYTQRQILWRHFLGESETAPDLEVAAVAGQFVLTSGQILDAVTSARDIALERGEPVQTHDLFAAARAHSSPGLSGLARKITPRYTWTDLVLPADQLAVLGEIIATVRGRPRVLEEWRMGQKLASSAGVTILFAGPPGTGKTMAAEVMAAKLGLDLYKIDLSGVVSKYIGETEKNLERIFNEAESSNAILFFDEADALFGKRSEVRDSHDRYANIEISYLLQRMETYDGVTILATNLGGNLDEAFTRRLHFVVDFPFPEAPDRRRIWQALFPMEVPHQPGLNLDLLAGRFNLAGGSIRNIIVNAAYLAANDGGEITMEHLLHGTRRELQKMGRLVEEADLILSSQ